MSANQGDLSHLPVGSSELPATFFEVEAFTLDAYKALGKFSTEQAALEFFKGVKTTTLKTITCWKRPSDGKTHHVKWTRQ